VVIFVVIAAAIILVAAFVAIRAVFFVGLDQHRAITIFRGVPYELPLGIDLYTRHYTSGVTIDQVAANRRRTFTDHKLRSLDDASDLVRQLETGRLGG
jgi:protein phosphatase